MEPSIPIVASANEPAGFAPADGVVEFRGVELVSPGGARVQLVAGDAAPAGRQIVSVDGLAVLSPVIIPDLVVAPRAPTIVQVPAPAAPSVIEAVYVRVLESSGQGSVNLIAAIGGTSYSLGPVDLRKGAISGGRPRGGFWARFAQWLTGSPDPALPWTQDLYLTSVSSGATIRAAVTVVSRRIG